MLAFALPQCGLAAGTLETPGGKTLP